MDTVANRGKRAPNGLQSLQFQSEIQALLFVGLLPRAAGVPDNLSRHGATLLHGFRSGRGATRPDQHQLIMEISCKQCGGEMKKATVRGGGCGTSIIALCLFLVGLVLLLAFPIGTLIGVVLMIFSAGMGKGRKAWKCKRCGYFFETE